MSEKVSQIDPSEHLGLIVHVYRRLRGWPLWLTDEDAFQEGYIALDRAARTYEPSQGVKFSTYAAACIRHRLVHFVERKSDGCSAESTRIRREAWEYNWLPRKWRAKARAA